MRIRQVRPEFWSDPVMGRLPYPCRLFYIGLWNVADDAGYLDWEPEGIGAVLLPYEVPAKRLRLIAEWAEHLVRAGRLHILDCGCGVIPTLPKHQRITGKQSFATKERHERQCGKQSLLTGKQSPLTDSPVTLGNGRERNGTERTAPAGAMTGLSTIVTKKKPADEEDIDDLLRKWPASKDTPAWRERIAERLDGLGIHDPDAEIARRRAA